jgi:uncharacterized protein Usg
MVRPFFSKMSEGYGLTTAAIFYRMPEYHLLQMYVWQEYDIAPKFPALMQFLEFWEKKLDGVLHSVDVSHNTLVDPYTLEALGRSSLH